MADKKTARRAVAKPRLLKALNETIKEHDIGMDAPVGKLIDAIKDDIVQDAMR